MEIERCKDVASLGASICSGGKGCTSPKIGAISLPCSCREFFESDKQKPRFENQRWGLIHSYHSLKSFSNDRDFGFTVRLKKIHLGWRMHLLR